MIIPPFESAHVDHCFLRYYKPLSDKYHLLFFDKGDRLEHAWLPAADVVRFTGADQKPATKAARAKYGANIKAALEWVDKVWPWEKKQKKEFFIKYV